jgi:CheY-like chemotaxis protein
MPTVFIVNSDLGRADAMTQLLRDAGFHTLTMTDSAMTLAVLNAIRADLFIVDLSRPQTRGAELIDRLRGDEQWARVPVIATGVRVSETVVLSGRVGVGKVLSEEDASPTVVLTEVRRYTVPLRALRDHALRGARGWAN